MTETGIETGVKTEKTLGHMQQGNDREVSHNIFIIVLAMYVNGLLLHNMPQSCCCVPHAHMGIER